MIQRISAITFAGIAAVLATSGFLFAQREAEQEAQVRRLASTLATDLAQTIRKDFERAESDLKLLATLSTLKATGDAAARDFESFARSRADYSQVRRLDPGGREIIRLDRNEDRVVAAAVLQDKSDRYYVHEMARLPDGEVYVSPLDWNVEFGGVEEPLRPTIRFGRRAPRGFVLLNADARVILRALREASAALQGRLILTEGVTGRTLVEAAEGTWRFLPKEARPAAPDDLVGDSPFIFRGLHWTLQARLPRAIALAHAQTGYREHLSATAIIVLLMIAGGALALRSARRAAELQAAHRHSGEIEGVNRELRRTRELLVERTRLATVGEMVPSLAHELRNPLQAMLTAARSLRQDVSDADGRRLLEALTSEIVRLEEILKEMLPGGKGGLEESCDLGLAARHVVDLLEAGRVERPLPKLDLEIPKGAVFALAVPHQLKQVLWNLVLNAIEATGPAGSVQIRISLEGSEAALEISDDGAGMGTPKAEGNGIGLTLCDAYVKRHGGRMELHSSPQGGVRVRLLLPSTAAMEARR